MRYLIHSIIAENTLARVVSESETVEHQMAIANRKIGIIGCGRVGSSLAFADFPNGDLVAVSSRSPQRRDWLAQRLDGIAVSDSASEVAELADVVFITTSDAAIQTVCDNIEWRPNHGVIHCSGVLPLDTLVSAKRAGASVAGFHPLQTFPSSGQPERLTQISYAIDCQDDDLSQWLWGLALSLDSEPFNIEGDTAHAIYHASAVLACGLLAGLVGISAELWEEAGIERSKALKLMSPMLRSTIEAIGEDGLPGAISGPYVRGDVATIQKHLRATADVNRETSRAYAALALAQLHIANEKGNLGREVISEMKQVLSEHLESL